MTDATNDTNLSVSQEQAENAPGQTQPSSTTTTTRASPGDNDNGALEHKRKRGERPEEVSQEEQGKSSKRIRKSEEEDSANANAATTADDATPKDATAPASSQPTKDDTVTTVDRNGSIPSPATKRKIDEQRRWRVNQMTEDYVELASNMMLLPTNHLGPYGYNDNQQGKGDTTASYPLEHFSSFGFLKSPLRRPTIIETWSPYEISLFEAGMGHFGKDFYQIHKIIQSKSTKEVIDFYYVWKKTSHYKVWKEGYVVPGEIVSDDEYGSTPVKKPAR